MFNLETAFEKRVFCGTDIFTAIKDGRVVFNGEHLKGVTLVHDQHLLPMELLTFDKELKKLLKELEVKFQESCNAL